MQREALKDTYLTILGKLASWCIDAGNYEGCIVDCQKILAEDPCREDAYCRLMCCHARLGQRSQALCWYDVCLRTLRAVLDIEPEGQTMALHERLLRGESI